MVWHLGLGDVGPGRGQTGAETAELVISQVITRGMHEMTIRTSTETANPPHASDMRRSTASFSPLSKASTSPTREGPRLFHENAW